MKKLSKVDLEAKEKWYLKWKTDFKLAGAAAGFFASAAAYYPIRNAVNAAIPTVHNTMGDLGVLLGTIAIVTVGYKLGSAVNEIGRTNCIKKLWEKDFD